MSLKNLHISFQPNLAVLVFTCKDFFLSNWKAFDFVFICHLIDLSCSCLSSSLTPTTTPKRGKRRVEFFDFVQLSLSLVLTFPLTSLQPKGFLLPVSTRVLPGSRVFSRDKHPLAFPSKLTTVGKCDQGRKIVKTFHKCDKDQKIFERDSLNPGFFLNDGVAHKVQIVHCYFMLI